MTSNKASLTSVFETGDIPTGANYADLIDSCVNVAETSAQAMLGPLIATEFIAPRVSATNVNVTGSLQAATMTLTGSFLATGNSTISIDASAAITVQGYSTVYVGTNNSNITMNDTTQNLDIIAGGQITLDGGIGEIAIANSSITLTTSAGASLDLSNSPGDASLSSVRDISMDSGRDIVATASGKLDLRSVSQGIWLDNGVVSAAGTAQATAATLLYSVNVGRGIVDGSTTGFRPPANQTGRIQYLYNNGASANLWPPTGGTINGLGTNVPFPLAASAMVTIVHIGASAYAVK